MTVAAADAKVVVLAEDEVVVYAGVGEGFEADEVGGVCSVCIVVIVIII